MSSCANTPILEATPDRYPSYHPQQQPSNNHQHSYQHHQGTKSSVPAASPSPLAANPPLTPLDDIPPLTLEPLDDLDGKVEGLHLVADSVAQMQQRASQSLALHPYCLAGLSLSLAAVYRFSQSAAQGIILASGLTVSYLLTIRYLTAGYVRLAEEIPWSNWLRSPETGDNDVVIGARFGEQLVGALVLRLQPSPVVYQSSSGHSRKRSRGGASSLRGGRGIIRAWTTKLKYRGTGIGGDLLQTAVKLTKEKCGRDAEVGFAKEHANSTMLLPSRFNSVFRKNEIRATKALDSALGDWEATKKKR